MFYLRVVLVTLWLFFAWALACVMVLFRWGDLDLNFDGARLFGWGMLRFADIRVKLEGAENLEKYHPCIFAANHQSVLDIGIFGSVYPHRTLVIGKKELRWVPFLGFYFVGAGNILIDRARRNRAVNSLSGAVEAITKKKASIWIFPEGTRNRTDDPLIPFKKGAFYMAAEAGVPVVPVVCQRLKPVFDRKAKKLYGGTVTVRVLEPIYPKGKDAAQIDAMLVETRAKMVEALRGLET